MGDAAVLGHIDPAAATVEPDDYIAGATLTNAVPGITLTIQGDSNAVTAQQSPYSSTGTQTFGDGSNWYWSSSASLRADFATPVSSVSIDLVSYDNEYNQGFLKAYDASGNLLQDVEATAPYSGFYTMTVSSSNNNIAYVLAGAQTGEYIMLDHLAVSRMADDYYSVPVNIGDPLTLATATPADGPGEFQNTFDPAIALYDPNGTLVASDDNSGADGRNSLLSYTAAASGQYVVEVSGAGGSAGDYVLHVEGATGENPPVFDVTATNPANGAVLTTAPTAITVDFNRPVVLSSLDASDLTVDGVAASGFSVVNSTTVTFNLPGELSDGTHTVALAAGSVIDIYGVPLQAYTGHFNQDALPPRTSSPPRSRRAIRSLAAARPSSCSSASRC